MSIQPITLPYHHPIAPPLPLEFILEEISALPQDALLVSCDRFDVFLANSGDIPYILYEIGRQREISFRTAGEGTGKPFDLDEFDGTYLHLFLWDKQEQNIAGGYRIGQTDMILPVRGTEGLYMNTLFAMNPLFVSEKLNPALELGRAFVAREYQRSFAPLMLLWKAIGAYILRNPYYHVLFGPVSIADNYSVASKELIVKYLEYTCPHPQRRGYISPRLPFEVQSDGGLPHTIEELHDVVLHYENGMRGVPVLLRHYLKLGATFLGANIDTEFSNAIDLFTVVDLTLTPQRILERYLGCAEAGLFLRYHSEHSFSRYA